MPLELDPLYDWKETEINGTTCYLAGHLQDAENAARDIFSNANWDLKSAADAMKNAIGFFGILARKDGKIFGAVDRVRSYPIFYARENGKLHFSNSSRLLKNKINLTERNALACVEFNMSGYVSGKETTYQNLFQIRPGECFLYDETSGKIDIIAHSRYFPDFPDYAGSQNQTVEELETAMNAAFKLTIKRLNGRPAWVSLSGGWDSRIILCKLKQLGYDNIQAYTYGPKSNYEAKAAKAICEKLNVAWKFFPSSNRDMRKLFHSDFRKRVWDYVDFLASVPFMSDFQCMHDLTEKRIIPQNAVILNGHSGDFTSGGHLPAKTLLADGDLKRYFPDLANKHYGLWTQLKTSENLSALRKKFFETLGLPEDVKLTENQACAYYELWEAHERQCKYVINGQKLYDCLGLTWDMPLWEKPLYHFWRNTPPDVKRHQALFEKYLNHYDFFGLFKNYQPEIWRWPGPMMAVPIAAQPIKWILGRKAADKFYKVFQYWGHYRDHYASFLYSDYLKTLDTSRNAISFYVRHWAQERGISF